MKPERPHTHEQEPQFEAAIERGIQEARELIRSRLNEKELPYHHVAHTEDVMRRVQSILDVCVEAGVATAHDVSLGRFAAARHDTEQQFNVVEKKEIIADHPKPFIKKIAQKMRGDNERASAREAIAYMEACNEEAGEEIFSPEDMRVVEEAIVATIPDFNLEHMTVVQPHLTPESSVVTRALALADICGAGLDGAESYIRTGDELFREENVDIREAVQRGHRIDTLTKGYYRGRMVAWAESQVAFAEGRAALAEKEVEAFPKAVVPALTKRLNYFDKAITMAKEVRDHRKMLSFDQLVRDMKFSLHD